MKRFPFPLRFSIPVILLLFGSLLGLFSLQQEVYLSHLRTEEGATRQAKFAGNQTSGILEYLYRNGELEEAEIVISQIGGDPNLRLALLCDQNNRVILATHYELQNRSLSDTSAAPIQPSLEKVRQTLSGKVMLSPDKRSIWAIYPVHLGAGQGELIPSRVGILLLEYDISTLKDRTYIDALVRSLEYSVVLALLCTTVWCFFDKTLTLRVVQLVSATKRLAKGEFGVQIGLQGSDELTLIAAAFDTMAQQMQSNQQQIQKLAQQRRELLDVLASQIRSSLDINKILSTVVNETLELLKVDRCNFLWCYLNTSTPTAELIYEAHQPQLPSVLATYSISNPDNIYLHTLQNLQLVRIDDLTTDKFLDNDSRSLLLKQGYLSYLGCAIKTRSGKLGIISCVHCNHRHTWTDDEVELLQAVANQLAIAVEQAELYEQTRQSAATATAQAEQLNLTLLELQQTQALVHATLDATADGILVINQVGQITGFNQKFVEMWRIPESILIADDNQALKFVLEHLKNPEAFVSKIKDLSTQPTTQSHDILQSKDGRIFEHYSQPQCIEDKIVGTVLSFRDVSERVQAEEKIRYQALHDLLTGLPNRVLFNDRLSLALANVNRQHSMLGVMFMDLDRFKTINDTLGHQCGDQLLQAVAQRLTDCLREGDTVARWGGDEFTLLLPQVTDANDIIRIARRILQALKPPFDLDGYQLHISSSIGIAVYPDDGEDAETLIKNADAALYYAKELGRNNYQLYTWTMNSKGSELLLLENSLHHALERGEFLIYYQPQVNIITGEITRMEALLRWQHPELGLISPGVFIPIAEENGLIVPIGEWVLHSACSQNKAWHDMGLLPLRVAVNLSARQLQQPNLVKMVAQILAETGLIAEFLELEITESTVMQDVDFTKTILTQLQQMGICLAMDDFGTGYSSLSYLKNFPLDTIKIDRSFIRDLVGDLYDQAIATAVIALGQGLNLSVVAEGVETQEQLECLRSIKCEEMQGYFFSRPLSVENATNLLEIAWTRKRLAATRIDN